MEKGGEKKQAPAPEMLASQVLLLVLSALLQHCLSYSLLLPASGAPMHSAPFPGNTTPSEAWCWHLKTGNCRGKKSTCCLSGPFHPFLSALKPPCITPWLPSARFQLPSRSSLVVTAAMKNIQSLGLKRRKSDRIDYLSKYIEFVMLSGAAESITWPSQHARKHGNQGSSPGFIHTTSGAVGCQQQHLRTVLGTRLCVCRQSLPQWGAQHVGSWHRPADASPTALLPPPPSSLPSLSLR